MSFGAAAPVTALALHTSAATAHTHDRFITPRWRKRLDWVRPRRGKAQAGVRRRENPRVFEDDNGKSSTVSASATDLFRRTYTTRTGSSGCRSGTTARDRQ